jgi:hypothetical protein
MPENKPKSENDESDVLIVITGDPVEGFIFTGPFTTHEAAERWAEGMQDWWTAFLQPPEQGGA